MHLLSGIHEYFKHKKTANVQCDNVKPFSSGGLTFACNAFRFNKPYNRIAQIKLHTPCKRLLLTVVHCFPLHYKYSFGGLQPK